MEEANKEYKMQKRKWYKNGTKQVVSVLFLLQFLK